MTIDFQKFGKIIGYFMAFVIGTVLLHWTTVNVYVSLCAPFTLFGPIYTLIAMGSPMCHFLNTVQTQLTAHYITLWTGAAVAIGTWITTRNALGATNDPKSKEI